MRGESHAGVATDFESALRAHGLSPRRMVVPDGRWHRCPTEDHPKKKNGAYKLAEDGRIGWYRNFATDGESVTWRADGHVADSLPPPIDEEALRRKRAQERRESREATERALAFYESCQGLRGGHPYLEAHALTMEGCFGLRLDADGWLVIPAMRNGRIISLQRIAPDGQKRFWPGASMSRVSYTVDRRGASITVLCEGLATGLAIFAAAPLCRVVVAFTASNMVKVAEEFPWPGMVTVAADNDHRTVCGVHSERLTSAWPVPETPCNSTEANPRRVCNPGVRSALDAAAVLGCGIMVPTAISGTDFCDMRQEKIAEMLEARPYGSRQTESDVRLSVDGRIAAEAMRNAKFRVRPC